MFYPKRPKVRPPKSMFDFVFEVIAIGGLLYGFYLVISKYAGLPDTIPIHFNAKGVADGFGNKGMIWLLPSLTLIMVPGMLLLRRWPWISNVPLEITEENAVYQYGLIVKLLGFLAAVVSLTFTVIVYDTIEIAHGGSSLLGAWFIPALVIPIFGSMIWYFIAAFRGR